MDHVNRFHTNETWLLVRAEHLAIAAALSALVLMHAREVAWGRFIAAFLAIDTVGYLPGAIACRRGTGRPIAPVYHHLYNLTHNFLTAGVAAALWAIGHGGFEWAMLALPIQTASPIAKTFEQDIDAGSLQGPQWSDADS